MFTGAPVFTGNPTAPSQSVSDDSTKLATTEFVQARITDISLQSWHWQGRPRTARRYRSPSWAGRSQDLLG